MLGLSGTRLGAGCEGSQSGRDHHHRQYRLLNQHMFRGIRAELDRHGYLAVVDLGLAVSR
jgi:hypothetical protein